MADSLPGPLSRLLAGADYSLADWYATPLSGPVVAALQEALAQAQRVHLCAGGTDAVLPVLADICRFWRGALPAADALPVPQRASHERATALRELVAGQLLISRKLRPAATRLACGFRLAASALAPGDYFRLLREHELLARLPCSDTPAPAQDLPALLTEAAVIRRLCRGDRRRPGWPHLDTLG